DIGKNLVDIILSNNGYKVIDLGIKVTPAQLIETIRKEKPDFIGLSGLLVKSAQQMVITAQDFKEAGIDVPILVGGAALSRRFTETKIAGEYNGPVIYSKDAMQGLDQANRLMGTDTRADFLAEIKESREKRLEADEKRAARPIKEVTIKPVRTIKESSVFLPADVRRHVKREYAVSHLYPYVNMRTLLGHHLG
ncbi:cobalamin-dependent protein, partial [Lysinibacillus xylanilyticus]